MSDWQAELSDWLAPSLAKLGDEAGRRMFPPHVAGLIGPGDRKVQDWGPRLILIAEKAELRKIRLFAPHFGAHESLQKSEASSIPTIGLSNALPARKWHHVTQFGRDFQLR